MVIEVVGSKMRTDAKYGQNGSDTPSSIRKGEVIKRSDVAASIARENNAILPHPNASDWQTRPVSPDAGVKVHPSMAKRAADAGSPGGPVGNKARAPDHSTPGGKVPGSLDYSKK